MKFVSKSVPDLSQKDIVRFWSKVDRSSPEGCWLWKAGTFDSGYGAFRIVVAPRVYRQVVASRIAYMLGTGTNPVGFFVCHTCDNPRCCNPKHLFLGTPSDNERDKHSKGRARPFFGNNNPNAKLSDDTVKSIRQQLADGGVAAVIAKSFGVDPGTISHIRRGCTWRHVL
jgi:hypothetical protein